MLPVKIQPALHKMEPRASAALSAGGVAHARKENSTHCARRAKTLRRRSEKTLHHATTAYLRLGRLARLTLLLRVLLALLRGHLLPDVVRQAVLGLPALGRLARLTLLLHVLLALLRGQLLPLVVGHAVRRVSLLLLLRLVLLLALLGLLLRQARRALLLNVRLALLRRHLVPDVVVQ